MSTTIFVDVTSNPNGAEYKEGVLKDEYLNRGKKANVRCFEKFPGVLGYDAPKVVILKQQDYLVNLSQELRTCVQNVPGRGYMITNEKQFDIVYREFFASFLDSAKGGAEVCVNHLNNLQVPLSPAQKMLKSSYQDIISFLDSIAICESEYKKTHEAIPV
jgi:hypothetical protein